MTTPTRERTGQAEGGPPMHGADPAWMDRALALAATAYGHTSPNPLVGAVLVRDGQVVGEGVHRLAGAPHAEVEALRALAAQAGERSREHAGGRSGHAGESKASADDLTLYVNLEPCSHQGRTPPCVEAILESRVRRVVASFEDPNPLVCGRGVSRLRAAGVEVSLGCRSCEAEELNHVFIARQRRSRPFVALKVALSRDGCIAAADGSPVQITGPEARRHTHRLRAGLDAVLIGVETLRRDRPRLDRRLYVGPGRAPRRLVLVPSLRADPAWLWPGEARPVVLCGRQALEARGARFAPVADLVPLPAGPRGLDLAALPAALEALDIHSLLVEGGGNTHRSFLEAALWDRVYVYRNPDLELGGRAWSASAAWERQRRAGRLHRSETLGTDRLEVFVHPAAELSLREV